MKLFGLLTCCAAIAAFAFAGPGTALLEQIGVECRAGKPGPPDPFLQMFDQDDDDLLSVGELEAAASVMKQLDANGDGFVSHEELPKPARGRGRQRRQAEETCDHQPFPVDLANAESGTVVVQGGFQTDRRDGGRPVALIAAALAVEESVFRDAFSKVRPARGGAPSSAKVHQNKQVLMDALSPQGVTNDRLDEVSNYYRYRPQDGEMWPVQEAKLVAKIQGDQVVSVKIIEPGSGYLTAPEVVVAGHPELNFKATLKFSKDLATNGSIGSVEMVQE